MAQVITRIYATADKAASAVEGVKALGYGDNDVFVTSPSAGATKADAAAALAQAGLAKEDADAIADEVLKGRTVVSVHAAFGGGMKVSAALDKFEPIAAPATTVTKTASTPRTARNKSGDAKLDDAAPLSNMLGWPTLLNSPTPFSDYFKLAVLAPFTSKVQLTWGTTTKVELSNDAAPLSRMMGWKTLMDDPAPLSRTMKWEALMNDPAPLSNKMNWPVLKD
jgi:hypothetical protein